MLVDELLGMGVVSAKVRERLMREVKAESVMCIVDVFLFSWMIQLFREKEACQQEERRSSCT